MSSHEPQVNPKEPRGVQLNPSEPRWTLGEPSGEFTWTSTESSWIWGESLWILGKYVNSYQWERSLFKKPQTLLALIKHKHSWSYSLKHLPGTDSLVDASGYGATDRAVAGAWFPSWGWSVVWGWVIWRLLPPPPPFCWASLLLYKQPALGLESMLFLESLPFLGESKLKGPLGYFQKRYWRTCKSICYLPVRMATLQGSQPVSFPTSLSVSARAVVMVSKMSTW